MNRPKLNLENTAEVYGYYQEIDPNPANARTVHLLCGSLYRPDVTYDEGAESEISQHLESGGRLILASNHTGVDDQFVLASLMHREKPLNSMIGNTVIPAKIPLFTGPLRPVLDSLGAIPTIRGKDAKHLSSGSERRQLTQLATEMLLQTCIQKIDEGKNLAMFPEATRNGGDKSKIQKIYKGISHIACGIEKQDETKLLFAAIHKPEDSSWNRKRVHLGGLEDIPNTKKEIMEVTGCRLQDCLDKAAEPVG